MNKTINFKRRLIASAVASVTLAGMSGAAVAQNEGLTEEVVVTGIRGSVVQAMDVKRNAVGVVDAISAEDIGKMPDSNLAESLQRITGVSINRSNGEGSQVTVRGISAELNMVTLNGRNMPAVSSVATGDGSTRAFDFGNIAAEGVYGVDVYKTSRADITSGGLGATINVKTLRPFDVGGTRASLGIKGLHDTTGRHYAGEADKLTPEVSGLYSWANDEESFGVALTGSYQKRDSANANAFVNQWNPRVWGQESDSDTLPAGAEIRNAPANGQLYNMPTDLRYEVTDNVRERINSQLTVQFRPVDALTATLDYTYSELDIVSDRAQQSVWFNTSAVAELEFDNNAVRTPVIYREEYSGFKDTSFEQSIVDSATQNNSVGFNLEYQVSDNFALFFDAHQSIAKNTSDRRAAGLNANVITEEYVDWSKDLPLMSVEINDGLWRERDDGNWDPAVGGPGGHYNGNANGIVDPGDISGAMANFNHGHQRTEIKQYRLGGSFDFNASGFLADAGIDFGIERREDSNLGQSGANMVAIGNWSGTDPNLYETSYFSTRNFARDYPDYDETTNDPMFFSNGVEGDLDRILGNVEYINSTGEHSQDFYNFIDGKAQWDGRLNLNRTIEEDVQSAYMQFHSNFDIGGMESNLMVGVRYEETDVTAISNVQVPEELEWQSDNDWAVNREQVFTNDTRTGSYDHVLPSIDFDISPMDALKLRLSYGTTIGRPLYVELRPDAALNPYARTASSGNPSLEPMESDNLDLSAEFYYTDDSYVSAGYFRKDVANFIGSEVVKSEWYGLRDVRSGPQYDQAVADLQAAGMQLSEENLHTRMLELQGKDPGDPSTSVFATSADPILQWDTNIPVNDEDAVIDGFELALQHWFGQSGFGLQANYTMVDADVEFDVTRTGGQMAMTGLSDSANFIGFYDKDAWQIRVAYNWRDKFLNNRTYGGLNEPSFTEEFAQIDFSITYEVNENVSLTAEGINVTGENYRNHGRTENQMQSLEDLGARYLIGARYTF